MKFTCSKRYDNLPAAHRQHNHDGHCALIHGHNWSFEITFASDKLDENGFVIDFGKLKFIKKWLDDKFDHTLLLNEGDPHLEWLKSYLTSSQEDVAFAKVVVVENCGAEKLAEYVGMNIDAMLPEGIHVTQVVCYEDLKNKATWNNE